MLLLDFNVHFVERSDPLVDHKARHYECFDRAVNLSVGLKSNLLLSAAFGLAFILILV